MFSFIKWFNSIDSLGYSFHLYCQSNVQFQGKVTPRIQILTSHWFFIVLAQVDQVPQPWVKLFHHTLNKQDKQKGDERSFRSEIKRSRNSCLTPCWLPIHRGREPWPLGACALQSYDWQTQRKQLENLTGADNVQLWRNYHPTMCCWAMLFDDSKRRGCALIHTQAQNAGNANKRHNGR